VKFKQDVKASGLTTGRELHMSATGQNRWHPDAGQVDGWYPKEEGGAGVSPFVEGFHPPGIHDVPGGFDNVMMDFITSAYCVEKGKEDMFLDSLKWGFSYKDGELFIYGLEETSWFLYGSAF
jgi:hypothetical protein